MGVMKINITKKEYRLLLDMLYLSDWVMHAYAEGSKDFHVKHKALQKKLLSYYKEMDAEDMIELSNDSDGYCRLRDYDEHIYSSFIAPFENELFWNEIISRLAERDLMNNIGIKPYLTMDGIYRMMELEEIKERYANEFELHGLIYVKIDYGDLVKN